MNRQKSFENEKPTLYLVPTPIGNLNEMTPRAIDVLNSVDVIACEDTRNSGQLLKHFGISKRLIAYQNFNEASSTKGIINLLSQGNNVVPISGCSAFLNALVASGLIAQPFIFIGFLPPSTHECVKKLRLYQSYPMTLIMYEAPHRIEKMLQSCLDVLGDRHICIARELTKVHEEFIRGTISEILPIASELKGEIVVVIEGNQDDYEKDIDMGQILNMVNTSIESGMSTSAAIKEVAKQTGISKNQIYDLVHGKTDQKGVC